MQPGRGDAHVPPRRRAPRRVNADAIADLGDGGEYGVREPRDHLVEQREEERIVGWSLCE
jgi:hypothetical protein